jgi:nitroimidazol reductase NimA-like FMN-containing flavoprotein (pyridoxamine 5'-phosphate oxidase superfamily)
MEPRRMEKLDTAECWRLAEGAKVGRLAVARVDRAPDVFPVNHVVHEGSVYLRTGTGGKLRAITAAPEVAYEIDGEEAGRYWSVVMHGIARRLTATDEIEASGVLQSASWAPTPTHVIVRITPTDVSGRRFSAPPAHADPATTGPIPRADAPASVAHRHTKPNPIPHQPPAPEP